MTRRDLLSLLPVKAPWIRFDAVVYTSRGRGPIHIRHAYERSTGALWRWVDSPICLGVLSAWVWILKGDPPQPPPPAALAAGRLEVQLQRERERHG